MYDRHLRHRTSPQDLTVLGETSYRNARVRFGLREPDRLRHVYLLGKTGTGKSTTLETQIAQDLARGSGVAVLDPHGELVERVLKLVPRHRTDDVFLIEAPRETAPALNVFRAGRRLHADPGRFASEFIAAVRRVWADSWGPRLEHLLRAGTLAVAVHPRASLPLLYRFFTDEPLRQRVAAGSRDPFVRAFWLREWPAYPLSFQTEALSPVLNKLGALLSAGPLQLMLSSERSRFDAGALLSGRGILLANLSVGQFGEDGSALLGSLILSLIQLAAFRRAPGSEPFYLYIDEYHRFATETTGILLAEGRKYGIGLVVAHQFLGQLPDEIRAGVLGNVGTKLIFRVGAEDANALAPEFEPAFGAPELQGLGAYQCAAKVLVSGLELAPFSARTVLPTAPANPASPEAIRRSSALRHEVPAGALRQHLSSAFGPGPLHAIRREVDRAKRPPPRRSNAPRSRPSGGRASESKGKLPTPVTP